MFSNLMKQVATIKVQLENKPNRNMLIRMYIFFLFIFDCFQGFCIVWFIGLFVDLRVDFYDRKGLPLFAVMIELKFNFMLPNHRYFKDAFYFKSSIRNCIYGCKSYVWLLPDVLSQIFAHFLFPIVAYLLTWTLLQYKKDPSLLKME